MYVLSITRETQCTVWAK